MQFLPHVAFAIVAISFAVRDILWLRSLAMLASSVAIGFEVYQLFTDGDYRMANMIWHGLFMSINGYQVWVLVYGERHVRFTSEEQELHDTLFKDLTRLEFLHLLQAGQWREAQPGEVLTRQDEFLGELYLIFSGRAAVEVDGNQKDVVRGGAFIGEMSFVSEEPASATVRVTETLRYLCWPKAELRRMLSRSPSIRFALVHVMGTDMSKKLRKRRD